MYVHMLAHICLFLFYLFIMVVVVRFLLFWNLCMPTSAHMFKLYIFQLSSQHISRSLSLSSLHSQYWICFQRPFHYTRTHVPERRGWSFIRCFALGGLTLGSRSLSLCSLTRSLFDSASVCACVRLCLSVSMCPHWSFSRLIVRDVFIMPFRSH